MKEAQEYGQPDGRARSHEKYADVVKNLRVGISGYYGNSMNNTYPYEQLSEQYAGVKGLRQRARAMPRAAA